jgi:hypothetical protein
MRRRLAAALTFRQVLYKIGCWGILMKARQLIQNASYDPAKVKALGQAFDDAWSGSLQALAVIRKP